MSCIVCMDGIVDCDLVCGHSFCCTCVKEWYMKGNSTCPMCRTNICFRGFTHSVKKWRKERDEQKLDSVFADAVDFILINEESESDMSEPIDSLTEHEDSPSPEPRDEDEESEWSFESDDEFQFDIEWLMNPPNKIMQLAEMEKKFNNFKDDYDVRDLLEIVVHPYYVLSKTSESNEYENIPVPTKIIPAYSPLRVTGLSQKRRRQVQTYDQFDSIVQLLWGQLILLI